MVQYNRTEEERAENHMMHTCKCHVSLGCLVNCKEHENTKLGVTSAGNIHGKKWLAFSGHAPVTEACAFSHVTNRLRHIDDWNSELGFS